MGGHLQDPTEWSPDGLPMGDCPPDGLALVAMALLMGAMAATGACSFHYLTDATAAMALLAVTDGYFAMGGFAAGAMPAGPYLRMDGFASPDLLHANRAFAPQRVSMRLKRQAREIPRTLLRERVVLSLS